MRFIIWLMYIVLSIYCMLDYFLTVALIQTGCIEINPVIIWLIGKDKNWINIFYTKGSLLILLGVLLFIYLRKKGD
jgi:hypothetical protein